MDSVVSSPSTMKKHKLAKKKTEISSSMASHTTDPSTSSTATTTKITNYARWKKEFNTELLTTKNHSSNNPLLTSDRYNHTIELINSAKLKRYSDRSEQEISSLKTYDVINAGNQQKLVKKINSSEVGTVKYYVSFDELFDIIQTVHTLTGHRGISNMMKEIFKKSMQYY
ncbi:unnamed protein product [Rotaria sp. Silwood1]|nr:unnamed protein product [Rotaria sp. Silwood1]CAF0945276.1 unnamed protein product [Rotaria sp. Silwood1]